MHEGSPTCMNDGRRDGHLRVRQSEGRGRQDNGDPRDRIGARGARRAGAADRSRSAGFVDEGREIEEESEREIAELALVLEDEGLPPDAAERVAQGLAANPKVFLRTKIKRTSGSSPTLEAPRWATRTSSA